MAKGKENETINGMYELVPCMKDACIFGGIKLERRFKALGLEDKCMFISVVGKIKLSQ